MVYRQGVPIDFNDPQTREIDLADMKRFREARERMTPEEQIEHAAMLAKQMGPHGEVFLRRFKEELQKKLQESQE